MTGYITLSYWDLALASILVLIDAGLSIIFGLKIHRSLLIAAIRMAVQLTVIGLVLTAPGCMMMSSVLVTAFALLTAIRPSPWYDPRYAIPLLGMILGTA